MKKIIPAVWTISAAVLANQNAGQARDLNELISSLYGGDGITLGTTANHHEAHFQGASSSAINQLNRRLATDFAVFPFNSSAGSFSFAFDADLGTFVSTTDTLGPIFAERAPTIGKGKWSVSVYGTFFDYDTFNGKSIHDLHVQGKHTKHTEDGEDPGGPNKREGFELDTLDIKLNVDASVWMVSPAVTYGVTDNLDVSALIPIVSVDLDVRSRYRLIISPENPTPSVHSTDPNLGAEPRDDRKHGSAVGVGDVVLGAKYRFLKSEIIDLAATALVKLPTGDENNFLGSGDTTVRPSLVLSRTFRGVLGESIGITPHLNVGYEFNANDFHRSGVRYIAGFEAGTRRLTLASEFLGSHANDGEDRFDAAVGAKWSFYKQWVLSANVIFPLNNEGLRSDLITTLGVGFTF